MCQLSSSGPKLSTFIYNQMNFNEGGSAFEDVKNWKLISLFIYQESETHREGLKTLYVKALVRSSNLNVNFKQLTTKQRPPILPSRPHFDLINRLNIHGVK